MDTRSESIFEINDFTTASPWERFEYELQELLRHWSLHNKQCRAGNVTLNQALALPLHWANRCEQLYLSKTVFAVTHLYATNLLNEPPIDPLSANSQVSSSTALCDTRDPKNDLFSTGPAVSRYFGLREFIIISPPSGSNDLIDSQDKVKLLLSSVACALTASSCEVAVFVQVGSNRSFLYSGIAAGPDFRICFDTAVIRPPPRSGALSHLNEVLDLFKEKVSPPFGQMVPASVSIRLMSEVGGEWPKRMLYESDLVDREEPPPWCRYSLYSGVFSEPVLAVQVFSSWETVCEQVVSESPNHSDLDPRYAPKWTVRVLKRENVTHSLTFNLRQLVSFGNGPAGRTSVLSLVREYYASQGGSEEKEARAALDRLARPSGITVSIPQIDVLAGSRMLISQSVVSCLLAAIFEGEPVDQAGWPSECWLLSDKCFKSAPFDSLTWRICHVICFISFNYKSKSILAIFWKEIVDELRSRWESGHLLPWIEHSIPDCSCCLMHQKLQMLDCCIRQKIRWEQDSNSNANSNVKSEKQVESEQTGHPSGSSKKESTASGQHGEDDEGEDEFFDAEDNFEDGKGKSESSQPSTRAGDGSGRNVQPDGRLHQLADLTLLAHPNEPLFVPICQDPTPMTDDMLQEQSEVMSKLGSSLEGSALRVKMQLPSLMSDMESFKAANPRATIEDFVRWYSPRDFEDGRLSPRMKAEGNIWMETWALARPVPARKQKRLFDYTKEAVKVLHFLTNVTLSELVQLVLPVTVHSSCVQLEKQLKQALRAPTEGKRTAGQEDSNDSIIKHFLQEPVSKMAMSTNYNSSLNLLSDLEGRVFMVESLRKKFAATSFSLAAQSFFSSSSQSRSSGPSIDWPSLKSLLLDLSTGQEVKVASDQVRKVLLTLFQSVRRESQYMDTSTRRAIGGTAATGRNEEREDNPFLPATTKEFVLHLDLGKPSVHSQVLPQRMYVLVSPSEVRFAVSTSEDTSNI